jgi:hypothetical protein
MEKKILGWRGRGDLDPCGAGGNMSKVKIYLISTFFFGLVLLRFAEAWGADWKVYAGTNDGIFYYDAENVIHPSNNTIRIWHKVVFSEKGIRGAVNTFGKDYENLDYSISLREINCAEKMFRSLSVTYYSKEGAVLDSSEDYGAEWHSIDPMAIIEGLYQRVCQ